MEHTQENKVREIQPAPPEEHNVRGIGKIIDSFEIKQPDSEMNAFINFLLNRLRESTTWISILLASIGIPEAIEEPVTQVVTAIIAIVMFFVRESGSEDSAPKQRERENANQ